MSLKLIYKSEIHKITKRPKDFSALLKTIREVFNDELPPQFTLQYEDNEGDHVIIASSDDYQLACEADSTGSNKSLKIYLGDADDANNISIISKADLLDLSSPQSKTESSAQQFDVSVIVGTNEMGSNNNTQKLDAPSTANSSLIAAPVVAPAVHEPASGITVVRAYKLESPKVEDAQKKKKKSKSQNTELKEDIDAILEDLVIDIDGIEQEIYEEELRAAKKLIHKKVQCNSCGVCPIIGARYKCSVLEDTDFCEECEAAIDHPYPLLKIKDRTQAPSVLIAVFDGESFVHKTSCKKTKSPKKNKCKKNKRHQKQKEEDHKLECEFIDTLLNELKHVDEDGLLDFIDNAEDYVEELLDRYLPETSIKQQQVEVSNTQQQTTEVPCEVDEYLNTFTQYLSELVPKNTDEFTKMLENVASGIGEIIGNVADHFLSSNDELPAEHKIHVDSEDFLVTKPTELKPVEVQEQVVVPKKQYPESVMVKAAAIHEIFPQSNVEDICEYINKQDRPLDELILDYMSSL